MSARVALASRSAPSHLEAFLLSTLSFSAFAHLSNKRLIPSPSPVQRFPNLPCPLAVTLLPRELVARARIVWGWRSSVVTQRCLVARGGLRAKHDSELNGSMARAVRPKPRTRVSGPNGCFFALSPAFLRIIKKICSRLCAHWSVAGAYCRSSAESHVRGTSKSSCSTFFSYVEDRFRIYHTQQSKTGRQLHLLLHLGSKHSGARGPFVGHVQDL
jgi:hypothetical protein